MYSKPVAPVAGAGVLAATGVYAGTAVIIAVIAVILGVVLLRAAHFRRNGKNGA